MDIAQIMNGALTTTGSALLWMCVGVFVSLPCWPCIWLSLARNTSSRRRWSQVGLACVLPSLIAAVDIATGALVAAHLVAATLVLLTWRHVAYQKIRFSLAELFLAVLVLAAVLALAVPQLDHWKSSSSYRWRALWESVPVIAPMPAILTWAYASFKQRWWALLVCSMAIFAFLRWWVFGGPPGWRDIVVLIAIQAGFALTIAVFVGRLVREDLLIWPKPIDQAVLSPDTLADTLPSNHAVEGDSSGEP